MEIRSFSDLAMPKIVSERTIEGYAIVFNRESQVIYDPEKKMFFTEIIERGAVTDALIRSCDIKAVLEHDKKRLLARSNNGKGTLTLSIDEYGVKYRFDAPNTVDGNFAVEMISRGDIFGSSFAYYVNDKDKSKVTYERSNGKITRRVHKIDYISDISPVADPAFFGTDVTVRSIEDFFPSKDESYLTELNNLQKLI